MSNAPGACSLSSLVFISHHHSDMEDSLGEMALGQSPRIGLVVPDITGMSAPLESGLF